MLGSDLPPPYSALKEDVDVSTEQSATYDVTIPESPDVLEVYGPMFEDKDNRIGFIQKVLAIKLLQAFVIIIPMVVFLAEPYPLYIQMRRSGFTMTSIAALILVAVAIILHCSHEFQFARPWNCVFLVAYPMSMAIFACTIAYGWVLIEMFICWVYYIFILLALLIYSIFALQSRIEFKTSFALILATDILIVAYAVTVPIVYGPFISPIDVFYGSLAMFALTAYMLLNLNVMMYRTYHAQLSPSDFVKAALIMHTDSPYMLTKFFTKNTETRVSGDDTAINP